MTLTSSETSIMDSLGIEVGKAQHILAESLKGADDGEIYLERSESEALYFDDGRLKSAEYETTEGFGLRVVAGETVGYAHASDISLEAIKRAADAASLAKRGYEGQADQGPKATNQKLYGEADPVKAPGFATKVALLQEINAAARAKDPHVVQVSVSLASERRLIEILRGDGQRFFDVRPLCRLNISVTVEKNGLRESGYSGLGGRTAFEGFLTQSVWQEELDESLRMAMVNLEAVPCPAGQMPVVLGPGWNGVLLHEAVGHGLEGDFCRKGTSAFSGRIGDRVAAPGVTVFDDGTLVGRRGSLTIDDEGTPSSHTVLIEDGLLVGYMYDRMNARLMGVSPTGNGRRQSYAHMPVPRMTNTAMLAGSTPKEEMIAATKRGLYCASLGGGQVDITNGKFVFQCTEAYIIEDGRLGPPVKGASLIGDGPTALTEITHIGDDFALDKGIGVCGKMGQGVPVGVGQPSLRLKSLTVGGTAV